MSEMDMKIFRMQQPNSQSDTPPTKLTSVRKNMHAPFYPSFMYIILFEYLHPET